MPGFKLIRQSKWRRWRSDRRSTAALEFALIAPIMVVFAGGVYDLCAAVVLYNEITSTATTIAASATNAAINADESTALSYDEVQQAESGIWADVPELRSGIQQGAVKSVTVSSVSFEPPTTCPSGSSCNPYTAYVVWSVAYTGGGHGTFAPNIRTCTPPSGNSDGLGGDQQVPGSTGLTPSDFTYTLPTAGITSANPDPTGPPPLLVADVEFSYTPLFGFFNHSFTFVATAMWPVRTVKPTQPLVVGSDTILPLAQQFTKIYGSVTGNTFTPYAAPAPGAEEATTKESEPAGTYCINSYQLNPYPYTTSSQ